MDRYRKRRFAENLDALLMARCVTRKEAAAEAEVPYQWLRRAVTDGLSRPDKRSRGHLLALAHYFGLADIEQLWERDLYVPPPPSSIKDEADRLAELMREYALDAGTDDPLLKEIVARMEQVVGELRARRKKLAEREEERRKAEGEAEPKQKRSQELDAKLAALWERMGGPKGLAAWEELREQRRGEEAERRREQEVRAQSFREAGERVRAAGRVLDLFRLEVLERWKAVGLPRIEEVDISVAEVVTLAEQHGLKTVRGLAPHVSDLWLSKYAQALGTSPAEARSSIQRAVSTAFGVEWDAPGRLHDAASGDEYAVPPSDSAASIVGCVRPLWWRDGYIPPSPIEDGASRLAEEMREYVSLVGEDDATLGGIVEQIRAAVRAHRRPEVGQTRPAGMETMADSELHSPIRPQRTPEGKPSLADKLTAAKRAIGLASPKHPPPGSSGPDNHRPAEASGQPASARSGRIGVDLARQALGEVESERLAGWRAFGLPGIEGVVVTPEELADHAQVLALTPDDLPGYALKILWLPKYARRMGMSVDEAARYIHDYLLQYQPGTLVQAAGIGSMGKAARRTTPILSEEEVTAREGARALVARVVRLLSPEQAEHFFRGYPSVERAESYLEDDLTYRLSATRVVGNEILPPQSPDEAVRGLVAEIVEDFEKSRHDDGEEDLDSLLGDPEVLVAPSKSLDHRRDDHSPTDDDHGDRRPVGTALEAEISRSIAEDRVTLDRMVNDFWEMLGDTPLPGGVGTYRDRSEALGDRMTVGSAALRACGCDIGKALKWLTERVDRAIKEEGLVAAMRASPPGAEEKAPLPTKPPMRKKRVVVADPEDIREAVLEGHRIGLPANEIIADLRRRPDLPDWVRRAKGSVLRGEIGKIVARYESEVEDGADPDEFDAQAEDDKRNWERDDD